MPTARYSPARLISRMFIVFLLALGAASGPVLADEVSETYDNPSAYAFDAQQIELVDGVARLRSSALGSIGYWRFDEPAWTGAPGEVLDASGNGSNGTAVAGASPTVDGLIGGAAALDGTGFIDLDQPPALDLDPGSTELTVSAWFKTTGDGAIVAKADGVTSSRQLYLFVLQGRLWGAVGGVQNNGSAGGLDDGAWHHAALVAFDDAGSRRYTLYVDGQADGTFNAGTHTNNSDLLIGARRDSGNSGSAFHLSGSIDELMLIDRALSDAEIGSLYNDGAGFLPEDYSSQEPSIESVAGLDLGEATELTGFAVTTGSGHQGDLAYQLSGDGSDWRYWDGASWASAGVEHRNDAATVHAHIADFSVVSGRLYVRAFLLSNGTQPVQLDRIDVSFNETQAPRLEGSMLGNPDPVVLGAPSRTVTYTLSLENTGNASASNPRIEFTLPPDTQYLSTSPQPGWSCGLSSGVRYCTTSSLAAGQRATFVFRIRVFPDYAGADDLVLSAQVTAADLDPTLVQGSVAVTRPGSITLLQSALPADGTRFFYNASSLPNFYLEHGQSRLFSSRPPGTYSFDQSPPIGWGVDRIECSGPSYAATFDTTFENAADYTFDTSKIAVDQGSARLRQDPIAADLIARWPLEGPWTGSPNEVLDATTNGLNGNILGDVSAGPSLLANGASFDGNDDAISFGQAAASDLSPESDYSVALWFRTSGNGALIAKADGVFNQRQIYLFVLQNRLWGAVGGNQNAGPTGAGDGAWHHATLVNRNVGGTFRYTLYLDGIAAATFDSGTATHASDLLLGARRSTGNTGLSFPLEGEIDEVILVSRALTDAEIAGLYNSGLGREPGGYPSDSPTIVKTLGDADAGLTAFTGFRETLGAGHQGTLGYQLSTDGMDWRFWDGTVWTSVAAGESNDAATVDDHIAQLAPGSGGQIFVRALLGSEGHQAVELDSIAVDYTADPSTGSVSISGDTLTVDLQPEQDLTCTFYNVQVPVPTGSITVLLEGGPSDGTDVTVLSTAGDALLDNASPDDGDAVGATQTFSELEYGSYDLLPMAPAGYDVDSLICSGLPSMLQSTVDFDQADDYTFESTSIEVSDGLATQAEQSLAVDLVAYWRLDENAWTGSPGEVSDTSALGTGSIGLLGSALGGADTVPGLLGRAGQFEASSASYVTFGQPAALDFDPASDPFTVSAWFRTTGDGALLGKAVGSLTDRQYYLFVYQGRLWGNVGGSQNGGSNTVADGAWHHAALVVSDHSGVMRYELFLDGQSEGIFDAGAGRNSADFLLGARRISNNDGTAFELTGELDEVAIWRRGLSASELSELWNSGAGRPITRYAPGLSAIVTGPLSGPGSGEATLDGFGELLGNAGGNVGYQLSRDGSNWTFWDGSSWTITSSDTEITSAADVDANDFYIGYNDFYVRALMSSDGWQRSELDRLDLDWRYQSFVDTASSGDAITVLLNPGANALCSFSLATADPAKGSITLSLEASPADQTVFSFYDLVGNNTVSLADAGNPVPRSALSVWRSGPIDPGVYPFGLPAEFVGPWQFADVRCQGNASAADFTTEEVHITVAAGEHVACVLEWQPTRVPTLVQVTDTDTWDHGDLSVSADGSVLARAWNDPIFEPNETFDNFRLLLDEAGATTEVGSDIWRNRYVAGRELELSPDGRWLVFEGTWDPLETNFTSNQEIFLLDRETDTLSQITNTVDCENFFPQVNGNGTTVAFLSDCPDLVPGHNADGNLEPVVWQQGVFYTAAETSDCSASNIDLSTDPNGEWITLLSSCDYLGTNADLDDELFQWHWSSDTHTQVTYAGSGSTNSERTYGFTVSEDGRYIFFISNRNYTDFDTGRRDTVHRWDRQTNAYLVLPSWGFLDNIFDFDCDPQGRVLAVSRGDLRSWLVWEINEGAWRTTIFELGNFRDPQVVFDGQGALDVYFRGRSDLAPQNPDDNDEIFKVRLE